MDGTNRNQGTPVNLHEILTEPRLQLRHGHADILGLPTCQVKLCVVSPHHNIEHGRRIQLTAVRKCKHPRTCLILVHHTASLFPIILQY